MPPSAEPLLHSLHISLSFALLNQTPQVLIGGPEAPPFAFDEPHRARPVASLQTPFQQAMVALCRLKDRFTSTATTPQWAHVASLLLHRRSLAAPSRALGGMSTVMGLQLLADSVSPPRMFSSPSDGSFGFRPQPRSSRSAFAASSSPFAAVTIGPSTYSAPSPSSTAISQGGAQSLPDMNADNGAKNAPFDEAHFDALVAHIKQLSHFRHFTAAMQLLQVSFCFWGADMMELLFRA